MNTEVPLWAVASWHGTEDLRSHKLGLAALYGDGPIACPAFYVLQDPAGRDRYKLRQAGFRNVDPADTPFRDLSRVAVSEGGITTNEPLVVDVRNADNCMLAQITALFASMHNVVATNIAAQPTMYDGPPPREAPVVFARRPDPKISLTVTSRSVAFHASARAWRCGVCKCRVIRWAS